MATETQSYDNLIGGEFPVVTERVTIGSGAALKRGTILGVVTASGKFVAADATDTGENATDLIGALFEPGKTSTMVGIGAFTTCANATIVIM
ncbi:head decoration protein [Fibrobacter sp.]|uniref:head decoration protein n=1 Tax=Fibrobacter sp. TaxID=35828 RepID=UPI00388DF1FD